MKVRRKKIIATVTILNLFAIAIFGDLLITWYYLDWYYLDWGIPFGVGFFVALGLLVAQPFLLCVWCALGSQETIYRILCSMGMLVVLALTFTKQLEQDGAGLKVTLVISGIVLGIAACLQIPLWIFRAVSKQTILLPLQEESELRVSQFGIKHLLISTTIVAVLIALRPEAVLDQNNAGVPWFSLTMFLLFFISACCVLVFLALGLVFNQKRRQVFLICFLLFLFAFPLLGLVITEQSNLFGPIGTVWKQESVANAYTFFWSFATAICVGLGVFYLIGFRLQKPA